MDESVVQNSSAHTAENTGGVQKHSYHLQSQPGSDAKSHTRNTERAVRVTKATTQYRLRKERKDSMDELGESLPPLCTNKGLA